VRPLRGERIADAVTPRRPPLPPLLSGDFPTWLAYQKDPNDTPFMVQSLYGREHFPNGSAYLARFALTGSVYGGPPSLELIELDAQDDRVFAKLHITAPAGFEWDVYQVIDMDPEPAYDVIRGVTDFKFTVLNIYSQGYTQKHHDLATFEAIGYTPPVPAPLPAPFCTAPVSACSFGSPTNTPAELANIAAFLAHVDNFFTLNPDEPATVAAFLGRYNLSSPITRRSGFSTAQPSGYMEISSGAEYLNILGADTACLLSPEGGGSFALGIDEVDAVGDTVFVKYRPTGAPIPGVHESYLFSVFHMDPAGSGLIVGNDEWADSLSTEIYADACS